jgi:hypothetical protein
MLITGPEMHNTYKNGRWERWASPDSSSCFWKFKSYNCKIVVTYSSWIHPKTPWRVHIEKLDSDKVIITGSYKAERREAFQSLREEIIIIKDTLDTLGFIWE